MAFAISYVFSGTGCLFLLETKDAGPVPGVDQLFASVTREYVKPPRMRQAVVWTPVGSIQELDDPFFGNGGVQVLFDRATGADRVSVSSSGRLLPSLGLFMASPG